MNRDWQSIGSAVSEEPPQPMPKLIWQMLANRGFKSQDHISKIISPSLAHLRDPFTLDQMSKAVDRLLAAREAEERVCIYADFDLDGTSGCALMLSGLRQLGFSDVIYYQPRRLSEGYGLHKAAIDAIAAHNCRLTVTVDVGITAIEAVAHANSLGMDIIITDHHLPKQGQVPQAVAVVNPNKGTCSSGLGHLSGVGVAFYLILALAKRLRELGKLDEAKYQPKLLLDCFTIGTLTDLVPLRGENRVLVKHGLVALAQTSRPGLRELLKALNLWGRPLTSTDVAIRFAPKLNALSRLELGILPIDLFLEPNDEVARSKVAQVIEFNQMRVNLQKQAEENVLAEFRGQEVAFVAKFCKSFHRGVVGLIATKVAHELGVPAFIGSVDEEGNVVGSARVPPGSELSLPEILQGASEVLDHFGGHKSAAGFQLSNQRHQAFCDLIYQQLQRNQGAGPSQSVVYYDGAAQLKEVDQTFMNWCEHLEPFGTEFATPVFRFSNLTLGGVRVLRGGHLKLTLVQEREKIEGLWFSPPADHPLQTMAQDPDAKIEVLAEPQWNYFAGRRTLQLLIQDVRVSDAFAT